MKSSKQYKKKIIIKLIRFYLICTLDRQWFFSYYDIFVKIGNYFHSVSVNEIQCFLIRELGTFIKPVNGKTYDIEYSLEQVQKLVGPNTFFCIDRNYLIHNDAIQDIYSYSSNRLGVKLKILDHLEMTVSMEKVSEFKKWLDR